MSNVECRLVPQPPQEGETRTKQGVVWRQKDGTVPDEVYFKLTPPYGPQRYDDGEYVPATLTYKAPPRQVVLSMPEEVAVTLKSAMACIGGTEESTYRGDTQALWDALDKAGIPGRG